MTKIKTPTIVLGSTSPFRKQILDKLNIKFVTDKPEVDETPLLNESPQQLVERLAILKADAVAVRHQDALVIGSDQVAVFDNRILGKPHTHENAVKQLSAFSGNKVTFLTGLAVRCTSTNQTTSVVVPFEVHFKTLSRDQIENYLRAEKPYNCAGSFKSEALGICLFDKLVGDDPNTLMGLPLIKLTEILSQFGFHVLEQQSL